MEEKEEKRCWHGVGLRQTQGGSGTCGLGRKAAWERRPIPFLCSQLHRATFLTAVLLLLQVKGVRTLKGSTGLDDEGSQKEKMSSAGRERREGVRGGGVGRVCQSTQA